MKMVSNEKQIRELVQDWAQAVVKRDLDGAVAQHTDDIVMFDVPLPIQSKGLEEYRKIWQLFFDSNQGGEESFKILELHIQADENVGFCYGLVKIFKSTARLTMGLQKIEGSWRISHEHHSYPMK